MLCKCSKSVVLIICLIINKVFLAFAYLVKYWIIGLGSYFENNISKSKG